MLELKVGYIYKDGNGDTIIMVAEDDGDYYPFGGYCLERKTMVFYERGGSYDTNEPCIFDLVEEIGKFHA